MPVRGRFVIKKEARLWQSEATISAIVSAFDARDIERCKIKMTLCVNDKRKRDIDNATKACLDVLVKAKILKDDRWIEKLLIIKEYDKNIAENCVWIEIFSIT